jgi:hypothetical protein
VIAFNSTHLVFQIGLNHEYEVPVEPQEPGLPGYPDISAISPVDIRMRIMMNVMVLLNKLFDHVSRAFSSVHYVS